MTNPNLDKAVNTVKRVLSETDTTEAAREQFVYDLVTAVYDFVKFSVARGEDTSELNRLAELRDAALPRV